MGSTSLPHECFIYRLYVRDYRCGNSGTLLASICKAMKSDNDEALEDWGRGIGSICTYIVAGAQTALQCVWLNWWFSASVLVATLVFIANCFWLPALMGKLFSLPLRLRRRLRLRNK